jgi:formylglycine-generating enzyme required for sulfatase activity
MDELPVHTVNITKPFHIGVFEVTQRQWYEVMGTWPSHFTASPDKRPVEKVNYSDCQAFVIQLSSDTGCDFRLPTEAEWEYACKAGTLGNYSCADADIDSYAWYNLDSSGTTHEGGDAGGKRASAREAATLRDGL